MGLLKGARIRYTESDAVIGDEVFTPPDDLDSAESVVPQAQASQHPAAQPVAGGEEAWHDGAGDELEHVVFEEPVRQAVASVAAHAPRETPLDAYDTVRDHLIESALEAAQLDAEAFGEAVHGSMGELMQGHLGRAEQALMDANPQADFAQLKSYVQSRVAVDLDLEQIGTVNELRWTHLQRIEAKILGETDEVAAHLEALHPPESFGELLAQREAILSEARLAAEQLMMEAQTRAAETMAQAEQLREQTFQEIEATKESIMADLREQAYQDGYFEGKSAGEAQAAIYVDEALQIVNQLALELPRAVKKNEEKLVALAVEIASKIVQDEISLQPEIVQRTVETALRRVSDLEQVTIKVNPLDLDLILPKQETFKNIVPDVQNFSIEGSHTIGRGGCIIETNSGSINATIATQMSIVEEVFRRVRAEYEDEALGELS